MSKNNAAQSTDPMSNRPDYIAQDNVEIPADAEARFPRLKLMQALSPELTPGHERFIPDPSDPKGKKALLTAGELILFNDDRIIRQMDGDDGIVVIPLAVRKRYVEYVPRDQGGGFVASYDSKEEADANFEQGNDLQTTIEFLVIEAGADEPVPFVITFDTISKLGTARKWAGYVNMYKTLNGVKYKVTAITQQNKKKQTYYNFKVEPVGWVDQMQHQLVTTLTSSVEPLFLTHAETNGEI